VQELAAQELDMACVVYPDLSRRVENAGWLGEGSGLARFSARLAAAGLPPDCAAAAVAAAATSFADVGVYWTDPFKPWLSSPAPPGGAAPLAALLGDAAHAAPPFLGTGANAALVDAALVGRLVREFVEGGGGGGAQALRELLAKEYVDKRRPVTAGLLAKAAALGYLEVFGGPVRDAVFRLLAFFKVPEFVYKQNAES
jgi:2-polyprenyl-6-methoxyphenol hydroxylase-like FAD-dependent oxidoreductase